MPGQVGAYRVLARTGRRSVGEFVQVVAAVSAEGGQCASTSLRSVWRGTRHTVRFETWHTVLFEV